MNHRLQKNDREFTDKERDQRMVGELIFFFCHTGPDLPYAVSIVSQYMHEPRSSHAEAIIRILSILNLLQKSVRKKSLTTSYMDDDWVGSLDDRRHTVRILCICWWKLVNLEK